MRLRGRFAGDPIELAQGCGLELLRRPLSGLAACFLPAGHDRAATLIVDDPVPFASLRLALVLATAHDVLEHRSLGAYCYDRALRPVGVPSGELAAAAAFAAAFLGETQAAA